MVHMRLFLHPLISHRYKMAIRENIHSQKRYAVIRSAAKANFPDACRYLGASYLNGTFGKNTSTLASAHYWLKKATNLGDVPSWYWRARLALTAINFEENSSDSILGLPHISTENIPLGLDNAILFCNRGRDLGDAPATRLLWHLIYIKLNKNTDKAVFILHQEAKNNQPWAMVELADRCIQGDDRAASAEISTKDSINYWISMVLQTKNINNGKAHLLMAKAIEQGIINQDSTLLRWHLKSAAENQIPEAYFRYGVFLLKADRDTLNAESWLRKATNAGYSDAAATLGDWLTMGCQDVESHKGIYWYLKAIEMGHFGAMLHVSRMVLSGRKYNIKKTKLKEWLIEVINSSSCELQIQEAISLSGFC